MEQNKEKVDVEVIFSKPIGASNWHLPNDDTLGVNSQV
jgi:hypothetical protein